MAARCILAAAVGIAVLFALFTVLSWGLRLRRAHDRCLRCCQAAGFPAEIYAPEYRGGEKYCICSDRTVPEEPRTDRIVCMNAGRQRR